MEWRFIVKRILITGKNSYIGTSVEKWLLSEPELYSVNTIDVRNNSWKEHDFSKYDVVFHVAGIAHVSSNPKMEDLYYKVNRDLTIEVARKAKLEGVKQFIFMSSIIVYGDSNKKDRVITSETIPNPTNFYGRSKLQAEEEIEKQASGDYKVVVLRPPMIYGKGSKGNYHRIAKLAQWIPIFPDYQNCRSMLYIDNLCEFIKNTIDFEETGIFFPQNSEYVKTSELVRLIGQAHGRKIILVIWLAWVIKLMAGLKTINKIFGNLYYEKSMSRYMKSNYQVRDFSQSIELTEKYVISEVGL